WQIISSVVTDAFRSEGFLFVVMGGWWVLAAPASHLLMRWGHKQTSGPSALRKSGMSLSEKCLLIYG
ncbi:TPA: hypothetical protein ACHGA4_004853, partial [Escherichia coli]